MYQISDLCGLADSYLEPDQVKLEPPPLLTETYSGTYMCSRPGVGVMRASAGGKQGTARVRVVPWLGFSEDFEEFALEARVRAGPTLSVALSSRGSRELQSARSIVDRRALELPPKLQRA